MDILAFSGPQGSGKTTTCGIIRDILHDYKDVYSISFADFLRDWIRETFGNEICNLSTDRDMKDKPLTIPVTLGAGDTIVNVDTNNTPRDLLISAGTFLRSINEDIFCAAIENKINQIDPKDNSLILIDDIRFKNELKWLKEIDYTTTLIVIDRIDVPAGQEIIKDFLDYEEAEYIYQTYSYRDPYTATECRNGVITMLKTITGMPLKYE